MKTGMIIVHYNDSKSVIDLVNNIKDYNIIDKIVIVDNNSDNEEIDNIKKLIDNKIEIIFNKENKGFSYAINVGSKYLIEKLGKCNLIISNADIVINKESDLKKLINYLDNKDIGVVAPTVIENNNLNRGWKNPTPRLDTLMNLIYIHRKIRKKHIFYDNDYYKGKTSYVEVVSGCFFLIKSDTLKDINYLDENVFLYYEENILSKKIEKINKKIIVVNDVKIIHNHSVSIDKNVNRIKKLKLQKSSQRYFHKNYNNSNCFRIFLLWLTAFVSRLILRIVYLFK